jgi:hypothetical protein
MDSAKNATSSNRYGSDKNIKNESIKTRRSQSLKIFTSQILAEIHANAAAAALYQSNFNRNKNKQNSKEFFSSSMGNEKPIPIILKSNCVSLPTSQMHNICNNDTNNGANTGLYFILLIFHSDNGS